MSVAGSYEESLAGARRRHAWFLGTCAVLAIGVLVSTIAHTTTQSVFVTVFFILPSMILSGMGPVGELKTHGGKIFAGCYALYSGLALITIAAITFGPIFHRFMHKFHLEIHRDR